MEAQNQINSDLALRIADKLWFWSQRPKRQQQQQIPGHAIKRARERYNFELTPARLGRIVEQIDNGLVALVGVDEVCHRYHVLVDGIDLCVVWDFRRRFVVSVLPEKLRKLRKKRKQKKVRFNRSILNGKSPWGG